MIYLRKFETHNDYVDFTESEEFIKPNVSVCDEEDEVHYNPIIPHDYSQDYLTFVALEDGTFTFSGNAMQYSIDDGATWNALASNTASPTVTAGNKIMWKQTGLVPVTGNGIGSFLSTGEFNCEGNIMSLYYGDDFAGQTDLSGKHSAFRFMFKGCSHLVSCENLVLPATTLSEYCYVVMFSGCTSLTTAPELPATTLANACYSSMFSNCVSLTRAPELPAEIMTIHCYYGLFSGCTSLNSITCLAISSSGSYPTSNWVTGVAANGTFTKAASATFWPTGTSGIPEGWTVQDA